MLLITINMLEKLAHDYNESSEGLKSYYANKVITLIDLLERSGHKVKVRWHEMYHIIAEIEVDGFSVMRLQ